MAIEGVSHQNHKGKLHDVIPYAILSFFVGAIVGLLTFQAGFLFYYTGYPALRVIGDFYMILGSLTIIGSIMVLIKKIRLFGAILILIFGLLSSFTGGISYEFASFQFFFYYFAGLLLPVVGFVLALYARKIDRARDNSPSSQV